MGGRVEVTQAHERYVCTRPSCRQEAATAGACSKCGAPVAKTSDENATAGRSSPPPRSAPQEPRREASRPLPSTARRGRSLAWVLYAALAVLVLLGSFVEIGNGSASGLLGILGAGLCALYARYLYRGGSIVFVPLPGCLVLLAFVVIVPTGLLVTTGGWR
jgi:hypothetical protein